MGQFQGGLICAAIATLFWGCTGLSLACWLPLPRALRLPLAPTLGWAVHSIVALPIFMLTGMTVPAAAIAAALPAVAAAIAFWKRPHFPDDDCRQPRVPSWTLALAIVFSCSMILVIAPRFSEHGVALALPVFDHAKIAIIDDIARLGVPAGNPFIAEAGGFDRLFYYYLWHFSAAEITILTGLNGWDVDAGLTGFTALCSLLLMMGLAVWLSGRTLSAGWALIVAATSSIRAPLSILLGWENVASVIGYPSGFGTWLFQIQWAPQHVASANCVVVGILLLTQLAQHQSFVLAVVLGSVAAAAFASSTWVGGVAFPLVAIASTVLLLLWPQPLKLGRFLAFLILAGIVAIALVAPLLVEQIKGSALRGDGFPIALTPFELLGDEFSPAIQTLLQIPVYWTVFLSVEFAAVYPAGLLIAAWLINDRLLAPERRRAAAMLVLLALVGLAIGGLLKSTTAPNNDLAWRSVLPSFLVLVALTGAGLGRYLLMMRPVFLGVVLLSIGLTFAGGLFGVYGNIVVAPSASAQRFVKSEAMWAAVRKHTGIAERVANNPDFLSDMTRWPINISWALLANRRSCYAGSDFVLPFAPLTKQQREQADALFARVFAGAPEEGDVVRIRDQYNCDVVVLTREDGAWTNDQLTGNGAYRLVDADPDWRIYRRADIRP